MSARDDERKDLLAWAHDCHVSGNMALCRLGATVLRLVAEHQKDSDVQKALADEIGHLYDTTRENETLRYEIETLRVECDAANARAEKTEHALRGLLTWAERFQAGDPKLDSEEWYIERDYSRIVLAEAAALRVGQPQEAGG